MPLPVLVVQAALVALQRDIAGGVAVLAARVLEHRANGLERGEARGRIWLGPHARAGAAGTAGAGAGFTAAGARGEKHQGKGCEAHG
jgi:hypothetical protein